MSEVPGNGSLGEQPRLGLRVLLVEDDDEHAFIVGKAFAKHLPTVPSSETKALTGEEELAGLRVASGGKRRSRSISTASGLARPASTARARKPSSWVPLASA